MVYFNGLNGLPSEQWNVQHTFRLQRITGDRWRIASHDSDDNPYYSADYDPVTDTDRHLPRLLACIEARESGRGSSGRRRSRGITTTTAPPRWTTC